MALILRNGGSQNPDMWLKEPRNNHFETTFSPLKNHFAGFEIFLENTQDNRSGILSISTYTLQGGVIETKKRNYAKLFSVK